MLEEAIKKYLEELTAALIGEGRVFPIFGMGPFPFLTYTITDVSGGNIKESQVEIKVISDDYAQCVDLRDFISKKIDMNDQSKTIVVDDVILRSELAGGGQIFNDSIQTWELSRIFIMKWRKKDG